MEGIKYITDENTKKRYVQIDVTQFDEEYIEDLIDGLVADARKDEPSVPIENVIAELKQNGKLDEVQG